jgi:hypothetical protein
MFIQDARMSSDFSAAGDSSAAFAKVVLDAISTSVGLKSNTATFSTSGKTGADVMAVLQDLRRKGYKVSATGSNVTISW